MRAMSVENCVVGGERTCRRPTQGVPGCVPQRSARDVFGEPRPDDHCAGASGCSARLRWIQLCHLDRHRLSVDSNHCCADLLLNGVIDRVNSDSNEVMAASVLLIVNQGAPPQVLRVSESTQQLKRVDGCWKIARRSVKT